MMHSVLSKSAALTHHDVVTAACLSHGKPHTGMLLHELHADGHNACTQKTTHPRIDRTEASVIQKKMRHENFPKNVILRNHFLDL